MKMTLINRMVLAHRMVWKLFVPSQWWIVVLFYPLIWGITLEAIEDAEELVK